MPTSQFSFHQELGMHINDLNATFAWTCQIVSSREGLFEQLVCHIMSDHEPLDHCAIMLKCVHVNRLNSPVPSWPFSQSKSLIWIERKIMTSISFAF